MPKLIDLTGKKFGRLTVISHAGKTSYGENRWLCKCDCGKQKVIFGSLLRSGHTKSCGCLAREISSERLKTHGQTDTRLFEIWHGMKARCYRKTASNFRRYGARGIEMCDEWKNSFEAFRDWSISHGYADNLTIDRIDNDNGYSPDNCRWTDNHTQCNNKSCNRYITANGETHTVTEWAIKLNAIPETLTARLKRGWSDEQTINTPIKIYRRKNHASAEHSYKTASY